jgi:hypothetical protein
VCVEDEVGKTPRVLLQNNDWSNSKIAPTIMSPMERHAMNASYHFLDTLLRVAERADKADTADADAIEMRP